MSRYARKVDSTHGAIRAALEAAGFSVWDTHANGGNGPDLVAGLRGATVLVECKTPTRKDGGVKPSSVTDGQRSFATTWRGGPYIVATDPHVAVLKAIEAGECVRATDTSNPPCARCESYAEQIVALALEAEQLDKRLLAIRNRFDPLNESGLFSIADVASVSTLATRPPRRCPRHTSRSVCDMQTANDLVARLRSPSSDEAALALEAADEIERLRHQIEIFGAWRTRDIEQAAEIRRLRTALRKACEGFAVHGDQPPAEWLALIGAADVASVSTPDGDKA